MTLAPTKDDKHAPSPLPRNRKMRISAMRLLAASALCTSFPTAAATVTNLAEFIGALNNANDENIVVTGTDIDLLGQTFTLVVAQTQFFGDGTPRTISNGTIVVTSSSDTNYNLLNLATDSIFTGDIVLNDFARLDIDDPSFLGTGGTVTASDDADIRLFSFTGDTNTYDATFFAKISGVADSTSFSITGNGEGIFTALPTFGAQIVLDPYRDFEFATAPLTDPTLTLGASLSGNHAVTINVGTLDLDGFDFTIDSLAGATDTEITLGSGTLTTGDGTSTTYAGVISGTGNLTKTGTGAFTLSGINTYTGTTTVSAGTLVLEADQTGPTAVIVQSGGTLQVNEDQTGTPTYTVNNGGIVNLNADLADTTAFTIDAGGLLDLKNRSQTLGSIAGGGSIDLGIATLTVGDATDTTFSGDISGLTGSLTKVGAGNLTLSGTNTYSGATTISAGTLTLDGSLTSTNAVTLAAGATLTLNGDINNAAPVTVATGATLDLNDNDETLATITGSGDITLGTATLTLGNATNFTFDGTISETGGLTKQGSGTLTLSAAQTYTGATTINAGTLIANGDLATSGVTVASGTTFNLEAALTDVNADVTVDSGGTFFGTATIGDDFINNGTLTFLGAGLNDTLTVNGDYTQGSTGTLNVQLGNAGGLVVVGTATVDGTLDISTPVDPANFDLSATYTVLSAGSVVGTFATVTDNFAFMDLSNANVGGDIQVTLARNAVSLAQIAQTPNQTTVATVLNGLTPTGNLDSAIDRILASSEDAARATYDQLGGAGAATASTQIAAAAVTQSHRLLDQVVGVAPGSSRPLGAFGPAAGPIEFDDADHLTLFSFAQDTQPQATDNTDLNLKPWASIYGGFGDQGDGAEGLDYTRYGLQAGLDLTAQESDARYGLALAIEQSEFDLNRSNGEIDIESLYVSAYTRQPLGKGFNFTLTGSFGYHNHDSERTILIGTTPTRAQADFNSYSLSVAGELSKAFDLQHVPIDPGNHPTVTTLEPFVRLDYSISDQDGYSETGAGTAGLNVGADEFDSSRVAAGLRVEHQYMLFNQHEAVLRGSALANFALQNTDSDLSVSFVNTPGSAFEIAGSDQDDVFGQVGVGLSVEINDSWDFHFDLEQQFSDSAMGTVIAGGLSYEF